MKLYQCRRDHTPKTVSVYEGRHISSVVPKVGGGALRGQQSPTFFFAKDRYQPILLTGNTVPLYLFCYYQSLNDLLF